MAHSHYNTPDPSGFNQEYQLLNHPPLSNNHSATDPSHASGVDMGNEQHIGKEPESTSNLYTKEILSDSHNERKKFNVRDWQWELSAAAFSLACFAAVVGVLIAFDKTTLSRWSFAVGITPNTVVATLSTFSRTALLVPVASCLSQLKWIHIVTASRSLNEIQIFDDASRGPWGSLEFVFRMHIKTKLASWGAFITILTLAMGPFAQQLISFPLREVYSDGGAFYKSQVYDIGPDPNRPSIVVHPDSNSTMNSTMMQGAILNGIFNLSSPVNVTCPGNCQWKDFATLAVTSTCQDVLHNLTQNCDDIGGSGAKACLYSTPSGFSSGPMFVNTTQELPPFVRFQNEARLEAIPEVPSELPSSTIMWILLGSPILYDSAGRYESGGKSELEDLERHGLVECQLRWTARATRNMNVANGTFNPGDTEDFELTGLASNEGPSDSPPSWLTFKANGDSPLFADDDRIFNVSMRAHKDIQKYLFTTFHNAELIINDDENSSEDRTSFGDVGLFEQLYAESPNRPDIVNSITRSMTYAIGQSPGNTRLRARVIDTEQYIRVHWLWIILPLVEVVMSVAFLVCTLIQTQQTGVAAWKSSSIVPFLTVIAGWDNKELAATSLRDINERSRHMKARLVPKSGGVQGLHRAAG